jgi:hypothetical protein
MFSTPSTTFDLPSYVAELANLLAEAPSPPPFRSRPYNKLVEDYLDIEADRARIVIDMVVLVVDYAGNSSM